MAARATSATRDRHPEFNSDQRSLRIGAAFEGGEQRVERTTGADVHPVHARTVSPGRKSGTSSPARDEASETPFVHTLGIRLDRDLRVGSQDEMVADPASQEYPVPTVQGGT